MDFHVIWYIIIGILLMGYAVLDGFDLGVGALHLFSKNDHDRRIVLNSIGPVWDGNEVWLVTAGGALFAAFPEVYATAFSAFYLPFMFLLFALIFRAVSIEFRSKEDSKIWRQFWDLGFSIGSIVTALLFGIAIGNIIDGITLNERFDFTGHVLDLVSPYTLLTGVFNVVMFSLHGAMYLVLKTEGDLQKTYKKLALKIFAVFFTLYFILTVITLFRHPDMIANFSFGSFTNSNTHPIITQHQYLISGIAWLIVFMNMLAIINIPRCLIKGYEFQGFLSSASMILAVVLFFALGSFPTLIPSKGIIENSLNIYNAASSPYTLKTMFLVTIWGLPFVLGYTSLIYWTYRGKTRIGINSY